MVVRTFTQNDVPELKRIHAQYENEFVIDNFCNLAENAFVIEKHNKIICVGGIQTLAEAIMVTDKEQSEFTRVKALKEALKIFGYLGRRTGHDSIHAFIQDDQWRNHLMNEGFKICKGTPLILEV